MINTQICTTDNGHKETRDGLLLGVIFYISFSPVHFLRRLIFFLTPVEFIRVQSMPLGVIGVLHKMSYQGIFP